MNCQDQQPTIPYSDIVVLDIGVTVQPDLITLMVVGD